MPVPIYSIQHFTPIPTKLTARDSLAILEGLNIEFRPTYFED
jgi:hypothetical protein